MNVPWREVTVALPPDVVGALENVAGAFGISLEALFVQIVAQGRSSANGDGSGPMSDPGSG